MSRDGSGNYSLPVGQPVSTATVISSTVFNTFTADVAAALTASIAKDGQTTPTANLPMGGFKHTGVADGTVRTHYASLGQVQDNSFATVGSVAGTNTVTGSLSPAIASYAAGLIVTLVPANTNTGATTLALNGLAAKAIVKAGNTALTGSELKVSVGAVLYYDGTQFVLLNPASAVVVPATVGSTSFTALASATGTAKSFFAGVAGSTNNPRLELTHAEASSLTIADFTGSVAPTGRISIGGTPVIDFLVSRGVTINTPASGSTLTLNILANTANAFAVTDGTSNLQLLTDASHHWFFGPSTASTNLTLRSNNLDSLSIISRQVSCYEALNGINALKNAATYEIGSFTGTLTGCTTSPTATFNWSRSGNIITITCVGLTATSNTTSCTVTGLPAALSPARSQEVWMKVTDNGVTVQGLLAITAGGTTLNLTVGLSNTFTGSGTKGLSSNISFSYALT